MNSETHEVIVVPDNELWLHQPKAREDLARALEWAQRNPILTCLMDEAFDEELNANQI